MSAAHDSKLNLSPPLSTIHNANNKWAVEGRYYVKGIRGEYYGCLDLTGIFQNFRFEMHASSCISKERNIPDHVQNDLPVEYTIKLILPRNIIQNYFHDFLVNNNAKCVNITHGWELETWAVTSSCTRRELSKFLGELHQFGVAPGAEEYPRYSGYIVVWGLFEYGINEIKKISELSTEELVEEIALFIDNYHKKRPDRYGWKDEDTFHGDDMKMINEGVFNRVRKLEFKLKKYPLFKDESGFKFTSPQDFSTYLLSKKNLEKYLHTEGLIRYFTKICEKVFPYQSTLKISSTAPTLFNYRKYPLMDEKSFSYRSEKVYGYKK